MRTFQNYLRCICLDWVFNDRSRISFETDRCRRIKREYNDNKFIHVCCKISFANFRIEVHNWSKTDELLFENDSHQVCRSRYFTSLLTCFTLTRFQFLTWKSTASQYLYQTDPRNLRSSQEYKKFIVERGALAATRVDGTV